MSRLIRIYTVYQSVLYNCHPFGSNGCVQLQRWKGLLLNLRVERKVLLNFRGMSKLSVCVCVGGGGGEGGGGRGPKSVNIECVRSPKSGLL